MRPKVITQEGVGQSTPFIVNHRQSNFKLSVATEVTGAATYTIQHTLDNPWEKVNEVSVYNGDADFNANANWLNIDLADLVNATSNQDGNYFFPIRAVRVNQTAGAGTVRATFVIGDAT